MDDLAKLSDDELLQRADALAREERNALVDLLCHIAQIDARGLPTGRGYTSSFDLCVRRWKYARAAAARRVKAARVINVYPEALTWLRTGELSVTTLAALEPALRIGGRKLLYSAVGKTEDDVQKLIAQFVPLPEHPDCIKVVSVRKLDSNRAPETSPASAVELGAGARADDLSAPAHEARVVITFTASAELKTLIEKAKDLMWHRFPFAKLEDVFTEALRAYVRSLTPGSKSPVARPVKDPSGRHIPDWVRATVWRRDAGQCRFEGPEGVRCQATRGLELDHMKPLALGGKTEPANLRLLCRAHNQAEMRRLMRA